MSLAHIGLVVSDLQKTKNWYKKFFNFKETKILEKKEFEFNGVLISNGEITIELLKPYKIIEKPKPPKNIIEILRYQGLNHIAINVDNINDFFLKMKTSGFLLTELFDNRFFFCTDPDGTIIEIKQK
jgi:catechol 2,3-dioxygenase-like lactoylglutathione lyase family enzyme